jgi:hypothetical protein
MSTRGRATDENDVGCDDHSRLQSRGPPGATRDAPSLHTIASAHREKRT